MKRSITNAFAHSFICKIYIAFSGNLLVCTPSPTKSIKAGFEQRVYNKDVLFFSVMGNEAGMLMDRIADAYHLLGPTGVGETTHTNDHLRSIPTLVRQKRLSLTTSSYHRNKPTQSEIACSFKQEYATKIQQ